MTLYEKALNFNRRMRQIESYGATKINIDAKNKTISDNDIIFYKSMIAEWCQGIYVKNDVRMYNGQVMRCVQDHDSTNNPAWTPATASLWTVLHGTSPETAQDWVQPTGAHDQYLAGEYCLYNGLIYLCVSNSVYNPDTFGWTPV